MYVLHMHQKRYTKETCKHAKEAYEIRIVKRYTKETYEHAKEAYEQGKET